jgi:hypothetical protein
MKREIPDDPAKTTSASKEIPMIFIAFIIIRGNKDNAKNRCIIFVTKKTGIGLPKYDFC